MGNLCARLVRNVLASLFWHLVANFMGNLHAILFWYLMALLLGNLAALLLGYGVAFLVVGALLLGDIMTHIPGYMVAHMFFLVLLEQLFQMGKSFLASWILKQTIFLGKFLLQLNKLLNFGLNRVKFVILVFYRIVLIIHRPLPLVGHRSIRRLPNYMMDVNFSHLLVLGLAMPVLANSFILLGAFFHMSCVALRDILANLFLLGMALLRILSAALFYILCIAVLSVLGFALICVFFMALLRIISRALVFVFGGALVSVVSLALLHILLLTVGGVLGGALILVLRRALLFVSRAAMRRGVIFVENMAVFLFLLEKVLEGHRRGSKKELTK